MLTRTEWRQSWDTPWTVRSGRFSVIYYCVHVHTFTWPKYVHCFLIGPLPETPRGKKYIITATDYFSKWAEAAPLPDKTAVGVADFLFSLFCRHGWPEIIISDQGREFVNAVSRYIQ